MEQIQMMMMMMMIESSAESGHRRAAAAAREGERTSTQSEQTDKRREAKAQNGNLFLARRRDFCLFLVCVCASVISLAASFLSVLPVCYKSIFVCFVRLSARLSGSFARSHTQTHAHTNTHTHSLTQTHICTHTHKHTLTPARLAGALEAPSPSLSLAVLWFCLAQSGVFVCASLCNGAHGSFPPHVQTCRMTQLDSRCHSS